MRKRTNEISLDWTLNEEDLIDFADFKKRTGLDIEHGDDFDCEISGSYIKEVAATLTDPPEGGYCEDVSVYVGNHDITDIVLSSVLEVINEKLCENIPTKDDLY